MTFCSLPDSGERTSYWALASDVWAERIWPHRRLAKNPLWNPPLYPLRSSASRTQSIQMVLGVKSCSVTKSHPTLHNPMDFDTPGFPVLHHLPEFAQTHIHWVSDAIQPSHPLSPPSPPALNLSQQDLRDDDIIRWERVLSNWEERKPCSAESSSSGKARGRCF